MNFWTERGSWGPGHRDKLNDLGIDTVLMDPET